MDMENESGEEICESVKAAELHGMKTFHLFAIVMKETFSVIFDIQFHLASH